MENFWLHLVNWFFIVFHTVLIIFNLFGWIFRNTRKLHLFTLAVTLFSWVVLGIWNGFGYCFLTDWHYDILRQLGKTNLPNSYIGFLVETFSGWRKQQGTFYKFQRNGWRLAKGMHPRCWQLGGRHAYRRPRSELSRPT